MQVSMLIYIKYLEIKAFSGSGKPRIQIFLLINVEMPTVVGILTFIIRKNVMLAELSMKFVTNQEAAVSSLLALKVNIHLQNTRSWCLFQWVLKFYLILFFR